MAIKANLLIDQGSTYQTTINVTDADDIAIDLTGYTGSAQLRKHYTSSNAVSFNVSITPLLGTVTLSLDANTTASIVAGRYVYDCELTSNNGVVSRLLEGIVTVTPEVTK